MPHVGNLFTGAVSRIEVFTVWAPVVRDGQIVSLVGVTVSPQDLTTALREERLPEGWIGVVVDRTDGVERLTDAIRKKYRWEFRVVMMIERLGRAGRKPRVILRITPA